MNEQQANARDRALLAWLTEPDSDDDLVYEDGRVVGARVTHNGALKLLRAMAPFLLHGLPADGPPRLTEAAAMACTQLLVVHDLRVFSRAELEPLLAEARLPLSAGFVFNLLRSMPWVVPVPGQEGDYLRLTDRVWDLLAPLAGKPGSANK